MILKILNQIKESVKTDSNVSYIRLIGWYVMFCVYSVWSSIVLVSLISLLLNSKDINADFKDYKIPGWAEIITLTTAVVIVKGIQSFSKNENINNSNG